MCFFLPPKGEEKTMLQQLIDLVDQTPPYNEIEPLLYLGSVHALPKLFASPAKIDAVVSITKISTEDFNLPPHISIAFGNHLDICLSDREESNISQYFDEAHAFINRHITEGHGVLVHCAAGISRSTTLVAAYLMKSYKWSAYDALKLIKEKRPCIRPNDGFLEQLLVFEKRNL